MSQADPLIDQAAIAMADMEGLYLTWIAETACSLSLNKFYLTSTQNVVEVRKERKRSD